MCTTSRDLCMYAGGMLVMMSDQRGCCAKRRHSRSRCRCHCIASTSSHSGGTDPTTAAATATAGDAEQRSRLDYPRPHVALCAIGLCMVREQLSIEGAR